VTFNDHRMYNVCPERHIHHHGVQRVRFAALSCSGPGLPFGFASLPSARCP